MDGEDDDNLSYSSTEHEVSVQENIAGANTGHVSLSLASGTCVILK